MTDQIRWQSQLEMVSSQIQFVRTYTEQLLADIDQESWYEQPIDGMNHIAWQVGHLTMAQYGLALLRQRGRESADRELIPRSYLRMFAKGSSPSIDVDAR
ncbi:MAG: DinB family protein, partial [Pirellulaceae bacterium]